MRAEISDVSMPACYCGFMQTVFSQGFQTEVESDTRENMKVLIFVDDTILFAKSAKEMQDVLDDYLSFTEAWRIRVNPTKCATVPMSKHCTKQYDMGCAEKEKQYGLWHINGEKVQMKATHKYLA